MRIFFLHSLCILYSIFFILSGSAEIGSTSHLSSETVQLVKKMKTELASHMAKRDSGVIECSLTYQETPRLTPQNPHAPKNPTYATLGTWKIIYRFSKDKEFYRIQENAKVDLNGFPLDILSALKRGDSFCLRYVLLYSTRDSRAQPRLND